MQKNNHTSKGDGPSYTQKPQHMGGPSFAPAPDGAKADSRYDIDSIFKGIRFPAEQSDLVGFARDSQADEGFIDTLEQMPESSYKDIEEFRKAYSECYDNYGMLD